MECSLIGVDSMSGLCLASLGGGFILQVCGRMWVMTAPCSHPRWEHNGSLCATPHTGMLVR